MGGVQVICHQLLVWQGSAGDFFPCSREGGGEGEGRVRVSRGRGSMQGAIERGIAAEMMRRL